MWCVLLGSIMNWDLGFDQAKVPDKHNILKILNVSCLGQIFRQMNEVLKLKYGSMPLHGLTIELI